MPTDQARGLKAPGSSPWAEGPRVKPGDDGLSPVKPGVAPLSGFLQQLFLLLAELVGHLFERRAVELALRAGEAGAFFFPDVMLDQLLQHGGLRGPLLARLVAGARHLLELLFDELMFVFAL